METKTVLQRTLALILAVILVLTLAACGKKEEETTAPETTTTEVVTTEPPIDETKINRLTGLPTLSDKAKGKRPIAIMINNIRASLPQYGIAAADLMFEAVVEGGITRMMAVYGDYTKVPKVCSIRSCRYYYPILAHGLDAVYICFGSNPTLGTPTLKKLKIDYFNGAERYVADLFGRDQERLRKYSSEHTAYVKGKNIPSVLKAYKVRTKYKEGKNVPIFNFRKEDEAIASGTRDCDKVRLNFSNSYWSTFTYNTKSKKYYKYHSGEKHIDSSTGKQLKYTNIFVLETKIYNHKNGYLKKMKLEGGNGYYISMGKSQRITWKKASASSNIEVFDADGKPLEVNPGKSYIGIVSPKSTKITAKKPPETTAASGTTDASGTTAAGNTSTATTKKS